MRKLYLTISLALAGTLALRAQSPVIPQDREEKSITGKNMGQYALLTTEENIIPKTTTISFTQEANVYPNPTNGNCTISICSAAPCKIKIELITIDGKTVWQNNEMVNEGVNLYSYSLNHAPGIYFLRIQGANINELKKIVIAT